MKFAQEDDAPLMDFPTEEEQQPSMGEDTFLQEFQPAFDPDNFYGNLVPLIKQFNGEQYLSSLASNLITKVDEDIESMSEWEETTIKGMKLLGYEITEIPTDSRNVPELYDSTYAETSNSMAVHIIDEILKPDGCVKVKPKTTSSDNNLYDAADYFKNQMNDYLTDEDKGFYPDIRQGVMWFVLTGNIIRKVFIDELTGLPKDRYMNKIIVNGKCVSLAEANRTTEELTYTRNQIITRIHNGFFDHEELIPSSYHDLDGIQTQLEKMEGRNSDGLTQDNYNFYIINTYLPLSVTQDGYDDYETSYQQGKLDKVEYPYKIWVDKESMKIMRIERNWDPRDRALKFKDMYYHWKFFTGYNLMGNGLAQMCGNNAQILNFCIKQILDSSLKANSPSFLMNTGLRNKESTLSISPSSITPVEAIGEIGKSIMAVPSKEPSAMLYQIINDLRGSTRAMGASAEQVGEFNPNIPVGTIIALIEQYMRMPNHIVRNIYNVFSNELAEMARLLVETGVIQMDFGLFEQLKITSVADPHLTSNVQRSLQAQFLLGQFEKFPQFFNAQEVMKFNLISAKILDPEKYLQFPPPPPQPMPLDPINENLNMGMGQDAIASLEQDHESHIAVHEDAIADEMQKPQPDLEKLKKLMNHLAQHQYLMAVVMASQELQMQLPEDPAQLAQDIQTQNIIARNEAAYIQKQKEGQQQPMDPTAVLLEQTKVEERIATMRNESETETARLKAEVELMKAEIGYKEAQEKNEIERMKLESGTEFSREKLATETNVKMRQHDDKMNSERYKNGISEILKKYNI